MQAVHAGANPDATDRTVVLSLEATVAARQLVPASGPGGEGKPQSLIPGAPAGVGRGSAQLPGGRGFEMWSEMWSFVMHHRQSVARFCT